jgi:sortase A
MKGWAAFIERILVVTGLSCFAVAATASLEAVRFQHEQDAQLVRALAHDADTEPAVAGQLGRPAGLVGRITIPRIALSAIVVTGDDEATLRVAVGHLPDTPLPWEGGNTALAAHRDTFFRPLERVQAGDDVFLETIRGRFHYRVTRRLIVDPDDVQVLDPSAQPMLTLITCYPFRYVGPAPRRFVVQAEHVAPMGLAG